MNGVRKLQPFWRITAFVTLILWATALGVCSAHCALGQTRHGGNNSAEALPPCHGGPAPADSDSNSSKATSFCITIKTLYSAGADVALNPPDTLALFQPMFAVLSVTEITFTPNAQLLRHTHPPNFVFTPEVYLGPAFRTHAPPTA